MSRKNEQGMVLVYVLIFLVVGSLLVASLVPVIGAGSRRHIAGRGKMLAGYAAEAGIKRVIADLVRGADAFSPHYTVPQITVNEHTPTIDIRAATIALPSDQLYVDPGVRDPSLSEIPAGTGYLMRLHHVKEGELRINWAYSPAGPTKLGISEGLTPQAAGRIYAWPEEHLVATAESSGDYNYISVDITDPGIYTIVFFNPLEIEEEERVLMPNTDKVTNPFGPGGSENTWIYVRAHQDYIITAAAADISVSAYVRQVPGPSEPSGWITNEVLIYSWNPP